MELDPGEISLMSAGACGAFVHGLEDEFMGKHLCTAEKMLLVRMFQLSEVSL